MKPSVTVTFNADTRADLERLIADFMGRFGEDAEETSRVYDAAQARAAATIVPTDIGDAPEAEAEEPPKKKRGRPRKSETAEAPDEIEGVPEMEKGPTPKEMRDEALDLLRALSAKEGGMALIKEVQEQFGIKKLTEVPDARCVELLIAAREAVQKHEEAA